MEVNKEIVYDEEWVELLKEARDLGMEVGEIRSFLLDINEKDHSYIYFKESRKTV